MPRERLNASATRIVDEWDFLTPDSEPQHNVGIRFWNDQEDPEILNRTEVTNKQRFFSQLGYDLGPTGVDGRPGPYFHQAVVTYQELLKDYGYAGDADGIWLDETQEAHEAFLRSNPEQIIETDYNTHLEDAPIVYLGWTSSNNQSETGDPNSAYVQFHVEIAEEEILRMANEILKGRMDAGKSLQRSHPVHVWHSQPRTFSTTVLNRTELNRMIKTIRRARDAVFGSDE